MKIRLIKFVKIMLVLIGVEFIVFIIMTYSLMSDDSTSQVGKVLYFGVKYILGFPLVLVNDEYPFFLERAEWPKIMVPLILLNTLIQTSVIAGVRSVLKK